MGGGKDGGHTDNIRVAVRCRPMNKREKELKCPSIVNVDPASAQIMINNEATGKTKPFTFDFAYAQDVKQSVVYQDIGYPLVESVIEGYNGTIFAYGQTGCGKTFSMEGVANDPQLRGIIPNSFEHIFDKIASNDSESGIKYLVYAGYIEIYNEQIRDLLGSNPLASCNLRENPQKGVYVENLTMVTVTSSQETMKLMAKGQKSRVVASTEMNAVSSRSHAIFMVKVETSTYDAATKKNKIKAGKLNLVDLAGSERQAKTKAEGARLKEATKINLSLTALGNVISALVDLSNNPHSNIHIPYRDSKLTRLLQDSLGGNTKTVMIACISPAHDNYDETLSTLRYANRAKNIKNKPKINEDPKDALLRKYQDEIKKLKEMLMQSMQGGQLSQAQASQQQSQPQMLSIVSQASLGHESHKGDKNDGGRNSKVWKEKMEEFEQVKAKLHESEQEKQNLKETLEKEKEKMMEEMMEQVYELEAQLMEGHNSQSHKHKLEEMEKERENREKEKKKMQEETEASKEFEKESKVESSSKDDEYKDDDSEMMKQEIMDLNHEFELEKQEMLNDMRMSYREMCLYRQIANLLLPLQLIDKIISQSHWIEEQEMWKLPSFVNDIKKVTFEALANKNDKRASRAHEPRKRQKEQRQSRQQQQQQQQQLQGLQSLQSLQGLQAQVHEQVPSDILPMANKSQKLSSLSSTTNKNASPDSRSTKLMAPLQMTPVAKPQSKKQLSKLKARPKTAIADSLDDVNENNISSPASKSMLNIMSKEEVTRNENSFEMSESKESLMSQDDSKKKSNENNFLSLMEGIENIEKLHDISDIGNEEDANAAAQSNEAGIMALMQGFAQIELTEKDNAKSLFHQTMFELDDGDFIPQMTLGNKTQIINDDDDNGKSKRKLFDLSSLDVSGIYNKTISAMTFDQNMFENNNNNDNKKASGNDDFLNAMNQLSKTSMKASNNKGLFSAVNIELEESTDKKKKVLPIDKLFQSL